MTFNLVGLYLLPKRKYAAMVLYSLSSVCFLLWALHEGVTAIAVLQVVLLVLNVRTIIIWRRDADYERKTQGCQPSSIHDR
jgi:hypothetical protein